MRFLNAFCQHSGAVPAGTEGRKIYVSLGAVFSKGDSGTTFDDLYKRADQALYKSKETAGYAVNVSEL